MPFMNAYVEGPDYWLIIDGNSGGEVIHPSLFNLKEAKALVRLVDRDGAVPPPAWLRDYTQNREIRDAVVKRGYGIRASASGYMDCTEWEFYSSKEAAMRAGRALQHELEMEAGEDGSEDE